MSEEYFASLIAKARNARSPEAIATLLKPVLFEFSTEFDHYLEHLLAVTSVESSAARTLKLIAKVWQNLKTTNQREIQLRAFVRELALASEQERPMHLLSGMDPNGVALTDNEFQQLITLLERRDDASLTPLINGLRHGLATYLQMEPTLLDWLYEQPGSLGFVKTGPWGYWASRIPVGPVRLLFESLERGEPAGQFFQDGGPDMATWVELTVLMRRIERHLIRSFENRFPNLTVQARTSILTSTFLTFAIFWADFAQALVRAPHLAPASFQNALQVLRAFAARDYFPLYGGLLAVFDGPYLRAALSYLGEPLRAMDAGEGRARLEKARVLNLLGYTCRYLGDNQRSIELHREALQNFEGLSDPHVTVANLVNLGSTYIRLREFETAIGLCERALVYARQGGDRAGEVHALVTLGNAHSRLLQFREVLEPEAYMQAENYLQQGLEQSRTLREQTAEVAALSGLGAMRVSVGQHREAVPLLEQSLDLARTQGDLWWEGTSRTYLAEALYGLESYGQSAVQAAIATLVLERLGSKDWRQPAGLLSILRSRLAGAFTELLEQSVGADGVERVLELLRHYGES